MPAARARPAISPGAASGPSSSRTSGELPLPDLVRIRRHMRMETLLCGFLRTSVGDSSDPPEAPDNEPLGSQSLPDARQFGSVAVDLPC